MIFWITAKEKLNPYFTIFWLNHIALSLEINQARPSPRPLSLLTIWAYRLVTLPGVRAIYVDAKLQKGFSSRIGTTEKRICGDFCGGFHHKSKSPQILVVVFTPSPNHHKYLWRFHYRSKSPQIFVVMLFKVIYMRALPVPLCMPDGLRSPRERVLWQSHLAGLFCKWSEC